MAGGFGRCLHGLCGLYRCRVTGCLPKDIVLDSINVQGSCADCGVKRCESGIIVLLTELREHVVGKLKLPVLEAAFKEFLAIHGTGLLLEGKGLLHL